MIRCYVPYHYNLVSMIYVNNLNTGKTSFIMTRNRIVNSSLVSKSIPQLELQAILLGVQTLLDVRNDMCGESCEYPANVQKLEVWSDSLVALNWVNNFSNKYAKTQKLSVFVNNRLERINQLCRKHPVNFTFISGTQNPADCVTRVTSMKSLMKTNYVSGPKICDRGSSASSDVMNFQVPIQELVDDVNATTMSVTLNPNDDIEPLLVCENFSDFTRMACVYRNVRKFVDILKMKLYQKDPVKNAHLFVDRKFTTVDAKLAIIRQEQMQKFPEIFHFFLEERHSKKRYSRISN